MAEKWTHCDKCHSKIENGKCDCGYWVEDYKDIPFLRSTETSIEAFNFINDQKMIGDIFSGNHHSGTCIIIFKGDHSMCIRARELIETFQKGL